MSNPLKIIIRFILFILVQVFVLNKIPPLHHLVNPYIYFLFILWLPFKTGRLSLMLLAFALGLCLDFIIKTLLSIAISLLILLITEFLFERKQRFRANTA